MKLRTIALVLTVVFAFAVAHAQTGVYVTADGQQFTEVGSHEFAPRKEERTTLAFPATEARYVRLTYVDRYDEDIQFPRVFAFTTEVEVYSTAK